MIWAQNGSAAAGARPSWRCAAIARWGRGVPASENLGQFRKTPSYAHGKLGADRFNEAEALLPLKAPEPPSDVPEFDQNMYSGATFNNQALKLVTSVADNPAIADEFALLSQDLAAQNPNNHTEINLVPLVHRTSRPISFDLPDQRILSKEVQDGFLDSWEDASDGIRRTYYTTLTDKKIGPAYLFLQCGRGITASENADRRRGAAGDRGASMRPRHYCLGKR